MKKTIYIIILMMLATILISGCAEKETEYLTKTGVIEDVDYQQDGFGRSEETTILFSDGSYISFQYNAHLAYLSARSNLGNKVKITYYEKINLWAFDDLELLRSR